MSHRASHWLASLPPDAINASAFRVLFHLCDAHNSTRSPETACFPSQDFLRQATGLSNGGLNNAINSIEKAGLLRRRRTRNADGTKGPTFYILGCDEPGDTPSPQNGGGDEAEGAGKKARKSAVDKPAANSNLEGKPSPIRGASQLHASGDKPVRDPLKEPRARRAPSSPVQNRASLILSGKRFLCTSISANAARECIEAGLVTAEQCRRAGIAV